MLTSLSIRDVALIDAADLDLRGGLNVLTGETGAGKSILLDALGLALGRKGRAGRAREGAEEGSVAAIFEIEASHPSRALLDEAGVPAADELSLRRVIGADGRARAFVNDRRVTAELLRAVGETLVEVHGQRDDRGLLNESGHRALLDAHGGLEPLRAECRRLWRARAEAERALGRAEEAAAKAAEDADYIRHAVEELSALAPEPGEEAALDAARRRMQAAERIREEVARAAAELGGEGAEGLLATASRRLEKAVEGADLDGRLDEALAAVDRAIEALGEAEAGVSAALEGLDVDPLEQERVEERLFAIRGLARKHRVGPDDLPALAEELGARLALIDGGAERLAALSVEAEAARAAYDEAAARLSAARAEAAARLDEAVSGELAPLKLDRARFVTRVEPDAPGPDGRDRVAFAVSTAPGAEPGPIARIASGGELSRFLLALKVQLAARGEAATLIFDEIDSGVGGATADAIGRRLARLAESAQVLVVTHSPQVAARGAHHWRIEKEVGARGARTRVHPLAEAQRTGEIARMLAGETVTREAQAAAAALLAG